MDLTGLPYPSIVGYVRVSTTEQRDGWSLGNQTEAIRSFAADHGLRVIAICSDPGKSGGSLRGRHGLARALTLIKHGGIGALVAWREDRLGRRVVYSHALSHEVFTAGSEIITLNPFCRDRGPAGGSSAESEILRPILAIQAEDELESIRRRVKPGLKQAAINGHRGGRIPLGYRRLDKRQVVIDEAMAAVIRRCFAALQAGETVSALVRALARDGIARPDGKPITFDQLLWSLQNPYYTGLMSYRLPQGIDGGGEQIRHPGHHPAIIDAATFAAVQSILALRAAKPPRPRLAPAPGATPAPATRASRTRRVDVLTAIGTRQQWSVHGIVPPEVARCATCQGPLYATLQTCGGRDRRRRVPVYLCHQHKKFGAAICPERPAPAELVDLTVSQRIRDALASGTMAGALPAPLPPDLRELDRQVAEAQAMCDRLRPVAAKPGMAKVAERLAGADHLLQRLLRERSQAAMSHRLPVGPLGALIGGGWETVWPTLTPLQRRDVVRALVLEVRIADQGVVGIDLRSAVEA